MSKEETKNYEPGVYYHWIDTDLKLKSLELAVQAKAAGVECSLGTIELSEYMYKYLTGLDKITDKIGYCFREYDSGDVTFPG